MSCRLLRLSCYAVCIRCAGATDDEEAQRGARVVHASAAPAESSAYAGMVSAQASANGVPELLVHRVIMRESRYNAHAVSGGNYGIMQIRLGTARAMGYSGSAAGLLDPETR